MRDQQATQRHHVNQSNLSVQISSHDAAHLARYRPAMRRSIDGRGEIKTRLVISCSGRDQVTERMAYVGCKRGRQKSRLCGVIDSPQVQRSLAMRQRNGEPDVEKNGW